MKTTKKPANRVRISLEDLMEAIESDCGEGFCLACGEPASDYCEPDARKYHCDRCGKNEVYGAAEILIMGACG